MRNSKFRIARKTLMVLTLVLMMGLSMTSLIWADSVGSTGGTISFASGDVSVEVPSAATSDDIEVTYTSLDNSSAPGAAPEGKVFGSQIFELEVTKGGEAQSAYSFARLVDVTVKYNDADLAQAYGGRADHVNLYLWDANFGVWNLDVAASRDSVNNTLTSRQQVLVPVAVVVSSASISAPSTGDYGITNSLIALLLGFGLLSVLGGSFLLRREKYQGIA